MKVTQENENQINRLKIRCSRQIMKSRIKQSDNRDHKREAGNIRDSQIEEEQEDYLKAF